MDGLVNRINAGRIRLSRWSDQVISECNSLFKKDEKLPYAYPCDNYLESILSRSVVKEALKTVSDKYCQDQTDKIINNSTLVNSSNYPQFFSLLTDCYHSLNVDNTPDVYITPMLPGLNALSIGTDNKPIVLVSRKAVMQLNESQLSFMIGHELGHILQKNLMCHTIKGLLDNLSDKSEVVGPLVLDFIDVPLNNWYRCAEYTADRAGYLCCRNMKEIENLFSHICKNQKVDAYDRLRELSEAHPLVQNRIEELRKFARTY